MNRIAVVGAHYDDAELGCGGTILKFVDEGWKVDILVITDSEYSTYDGELIRGKETAEEEGRLAASYMGASVECLNARTKHVHCTSWLIEEINLFLDKVAPTYIFAHWIGDLHEDHNEVARATLVAARHFPSLFVFRSNWYHSPMDFVGNVYVDISKYMGKKEELLRIHETEYKRRGLAWTDFINTRAREAGLRIGVDYAEEFNAAKLLLR